MRKWPWAGAAVATAVFVGVVAGRSPRGEAAGDSFAPTPLLSVRRDPAWIESTLAAQRFNATLTPMFAHEFGGSSGASGCVEVSQGSTVLYSLNADQELMPASNMKLLTATALLDRLGPNYRLTTRVVAPSTPAGGTLRGNLYLVGGGDPLLMTNAYAGSSYVAGLDPNPPVYTSLDQLAAQVKQAGIGVVTGSIIGDDSRFDENRSVPTWQPNYISEGDVAPLSALEVDDDVPPAPPPPTNPAKTPAPSEGKAQAAQPSPPDPPANAATIFATLLRAEGVAVDGGAAAGSAPPGSGVVAQIQSPPLATEIENALRISDDTAAELLTKELGYVEAHSGTTSAGTAAVRADLQSDGLPASQLVNPDGSGLDRGDRVTCNLLDQVLTRDGPNSPVAQGLPVAASTGTLIHRLNGTPAAGRLEGKTGTLEDVAALSGFITVPATAPTAGLKAPLVFSIIVNGPNFAQGQVMIDRIAVALTSYPTVPALASVESIP